MTQQVTSASLIPFYGSFNHHLERVIVEFVGWGDPFAEALAGDKTRSGSAIEWVREKIALANEDRAKSRSEGFRDAVVDLFRRNNLLLSYVPQFNTQRTFITQDGVKLTDRHREVVINAENLSSFDSLCRCTGDVPEPKLLCSLRPKMQLDGEKSVPGFLLTMTQTTEGWMNTERWEVGYMQRLHLAYTQAVRGGKPDEDRRPPVASSTSDDEQMNFLEGLIQNKNPVLELAGPVPQKKPIAKKDELPRPPPLFSMTPIDPRQPGWAGKMPWQN